MYRLLTIGALILVCDCLPRSPRIYNVLITSKKNLSPSHALPVFEPVLRTTSFGYAFPPLLYHTAPIFEYSLSQPRQTFVESSPDSGNSAVEDHPVQSLVQPNPVSIPNSQLANGESNKADVNYYRPGRGEDFRRFFKNSDDPKNTVANLKKNPEIPDVPPPPIPVKNI